MTIIVGHGLFFSANGSTMSRLAPAGNLGIPVRLLPNGTFILARAFTAQPLASRMGPRFRFRSLSQAMIIDGIEIISMREMITNGICQAGKLISPAETVANAP